MTVAEIIQTAALEADNFANTLQADAPEAAVYVLNELDEVAACVSLPCLAACDAVAKLSGAANYCRRTFPRFSLGEESAAALDNAAASLAVRLAATAK